VEEIKQEVKPAFIILFGSFAKGTTHAKSDMDIAYFSDKQLSPYERFLLAGELALVAGREIDLVDIKQIDTVFTMQIFEHGTPIYIGDENEFIRQKMRAYSMFVTLNEQRAPIIDAIKERGSVFGNE
jgi:predicted nucleotidyltransferase